MSENTGPIFVLGCGRSGTTVLRLMLNRHPNIAIPGETWFFPDVDADRGRIDAMPEADWRSCLTQRIVESAVFPELGVTREALATELARIPRGDWPSVVSCVNRAFARAERKPRWGDKTPGYVRCLPVIKRLFPDASIIHVIRDGRDVTLSFLEQPFGPNGILEGADYWRADVERGQRDGPRLFGAAYLEVRYEELVSQPANVLERICENIREQFEPGMLEYSQSAQRYLYRDHVWHNRTSEALTTTRSERWRAEMSKNNVALFELAAGSLLRRLGYPVTRMWTVKAYSDWVRNRSATKGRALILRAKLAAHRLLRRKSDRGGSGVSR